MMPAICVKKRIWQAIGKLLDVDSKANLQIRYIHTTHQSSDPAKDTNRTPCSYHLQAWVSRIDLGFTIKIYKNIDKISIFGMEDQKGKRKGKRERNDGRVESRCTIHASCMVGQLYPPALNECAERRINIQRQYE